MRSNLIVLVLFCFSFEPISMQKFTELNMNWFNHVMKYLLRNNDISIDTFVLVDNPDECNNYTLCTNLWKILFEDHLKVWSEKGYVPFMKHANPNDSVTTTPIDPYNKLFVLTSQMTDTYLFRSQNSRSFADNTWLILLDESNFTYNMEDRVDDFVKTFGLENHPGFHIDSQVYLLLKHGSSLSMYEVFRTCNNVPLTIKRILKIKMDNVVKEGMDSFIWNRRDNLLGCSIPVAYINGPPYFFPAPIQHESCENSKTNEHDQKEGICISNTKNNLMINGSQMVGKSAYMFELLIVALNFTPSWKKADDDSYGVFNNETNEWNSISIMSLVVDHMAELSAIELSVTETRSSYVSFSTQVELIRSRLYMQRPPSAYSWTTFLEVFNHLYWVLFFSLTLISILLVAGFMFVLSTFKPQFISNWMDRIASSASVVGLGLLDLDADLAVNVDFQSPNSMRLLFFSVSMFGLLNKEAYEAGLTSQLTVQKITSPINSLEELSSNAKYQILVTSNSADLDYFKEATDTSNQAAYRIYNKQIRNKKEAMVNGIETAKDIILNDPYKVYFSSEVAMVTGVSEYPCDLVASQKDYFKSSTAYPFYSGSHYLKLFSNKIRTLGETGQYDLVAKQAIKEKPIYNCLRDEAGYNELGYKTIFTAFLLIALGALIATCYCMLEYIVVRYVLCYRK